MSVQDIWLTNLRLLVDELSRANDDKRGAFREVAARSGLAEEYIYQLYHGKPKADGSPRTMGPRAAKAISRAFADGKDPGWFDRLYQSADGGVAEPPTPGATEALLSEFLRHSPASERRKVLDELRVQLVKARSKYVQEDLDRLFNTIDALEKPPKGTH